MDTCSGKVMGGRTGRMPCGDGGGGRGDAPANQECREPAHAGRGRGGSPWSLWREHGPAATLAPDHQPPKLTDETFPLF